MNPEVKKLLQKAVSENKDEQNEAVLQIAMLLEKGSQGIDPHYRYEDIMPKTLLNVSLSVDEQSELIQMLESLLNSSKMTPSVLWALGKSSSLVAFEILLSWLHRQSVFTTETSWQALIAIDNFTTQSEVGKLKPEIMSIADKHEVIGTLQKIFTLGTPKVQLLAEKLLLRLAHKN